MEQKYSTIEECETYIWNRLADAMYLSEEHITRAAYRTMTNGNEDLAENLIEQLSESNPAKELKIAREGRLKGLYGSAVAFYELAAGKAPLIRESVSDLIRMVKEEAKNKVEVLDAA